MLGDRDPKTAECWHCNLKYADVYTNDNKQLVGKCGSCGDVHVIVSAPKVKPINKGEVNNAKTV